MSTVVYHTTETVDLGLCQVHGIRRCTICHPPPWLWPQRSEEEVSEA